MLFQKQESEATQESQSETDNTKKTQILDLIKTIQARRTQQRKELSGLLPPPKPQEQDVEVEQTSRANIRRKLAAGCAGGIAALHKCGMVHRQLSSGSYIVSNRVVIDSMAKRGLMPVDPKLIKELDRASAAHLKCDDNFFADDVANAQKAINDASRSPPHGYATKRLMEVDFAALLPNRTRLQECSFNEMRVVLRDTQTVRILDCNANPPPLLPDPLCLSDPCVWFGNANEQDAASLFQPLTGSNSGLNLKVGVHSQRSIFDHLFRVSGKQADQVLGCLCLCVVFLSHSISCSLPIYVTQICPTTPSVLRSFWWSVSRPARSKVRSRTVTSKKWWIMLDHG